MIQKEKIKKEEPTDFQKFQNAVGMRNPATMGISEIALKAGLSIKKVEDIFIHYNDYRTGKRK